MIFNIIYHPQQCHETIVNIRAFGRKNSKEVRKMNLFFLRLMLSPLAELILDNESVFSLLTLIG